MTGVEIVLICFFVAIVIILLLLTQMSHKSKRLLKEINSANAPKTVNDFEIKKLSVIAPFIYAGIVVCFMLLIGIVYKYFEDTIYTGHIMEWLNIIIRWMHITFGIAWIGTSFFFVFMENSLAKNAKKPELKGNLWMLHGGGFWFVEKYKVAPKVMPAGVHWFKYESYFTWLTGFGLLFIVYYFNAAAMLVNPEIFDISGLTGTYIGIGSLVIGYLMYHLLSLTPLLKKPLLFGIVLFVILIGFGYFYTQVFTPRAAYIHFGALIGSMMAGNVFFVIIPSQKAMVKATIDGTYLDPSIGDFAGLRSFHNNYFTLPVLFIMISNHFPSTFGYKEPWIILALLTIASAGVKHYLNLLEKHQESVWVLPISILILLSTMFITAPNQVGGDCDKVFFPQVYSIMEQRCNTCHSSSPTDNVYTVPPNGVVFDTPHDIVTKGALILQRVVHTKTMPQNNKTGMTPEERELLRCWIAQGMPTE